MNPYDKSKLPQSFYQKLKREEKIGLNTRFRALRSRQEENETNAPGSVAPPPPPPPEPEPVQAFSGISDDEVTLKRQAGVPSKIIGQKPTTYLKCIAYMRSRISPTRI